MQDVLERTDVYFLSIISAGTDSNYIVPTRTVQTEEREV
jgi:hypothetical protein